MKKFVIAAVIAVSLIGGVASAQTYSTGSCTSVSSYLSYGSRGSQVLALQQFLVSQNYPGGGTWMETGYFGTATRAAVIDFQEAQGLPQSGVVDSASLSALQRVSCGGTSYTSPGYPSTSYITPYTGTNYPYGYTTGTYGYPYNYGNTYNYGYGAPTITSLSQNTGTPGQSVTIYGQGFLSTNTVYFNGQAVSAISNGSTQISFTIPYNGVSYGTNQSVTLYVSNQEGTSNSISFTLNPSISSGCGTTYPYSYNNCNCNTTYGYNYSTCGCSSTYAYTSNCSTCGYTYSTYPYTSNCQGNTNSPTITYLNPQSGGVGATVTIYGSGFTTSNNTVHFGNGIITGLGSPDGQSLSFQVPSQLTGYGSAPIVLGNYNVSVTNSNNVTSNAVPFTVTSTTSGTGSPTITTVSGPSNVQTGVQNTWTVTINNPNSNYVTVSASWGDTGNGYVNQAAPQLVYGGTQTVTFSHAYNTVGTYTLTFTVGNQNGQSNTYTESINVSGSSVNGGTPTINYISPSSAYIGAQVTIYGTNFSTTGNNTINFGNGTIQNVYSSNGTSITFTVPSFISIYCAPGLVCGTAPVPVSVGTDNISVMDQYGTSNQVSFTVL